MSDREKFKVTPQGVIVGAPREELAFDPWQLAESLERMAAHARMEPQAAGAVPAVRIVLGVGDAVKLAQILKSIPRVP